MVEPVPLVHHPLGSEAGLHVGEPPGSVVCPERRQRNRPLVVCRHCRVKNVEKSCVLSKSGSPLLRCSGRAVYLYSTAHKTQLTILQLEDFLPASLFPDLLPQPIGGFINNIFRELNVMTKLIINTMSPQN